MDEKYWMRGLRKSSYCVQWIGIFLGLWCMTTVSAQAGRLVDLNFSAAPNINAHSNQLIDLNVAALPNDQLELTLKFNANPPAISSYITDQPARIAFDLPGIKSVLTKKYFTIGSGNARSVRVVEATDRTRVMIELMELSNYTTRIEGHQLVIVIGRGAAPIDAVSDRHRESHAENLIRSVDFHRGDQGVGLVVLKLRNPSAIVNVHDEGGRITAEFFNTNIASSYQRQFDVSDFATPVKRIDAVNQGKNSLITIKPNGHYEYIAYQTNDLFTISVRAVTEEDLNKKNQDKFIYTGEKLSLNFQDIEIRAVLQLIADFIGVNLVASDTVSGKLTLRLKDVPWDQALDLVLKTKGLDKRKIGNVLLVAPASELAAQEKIESDSSRQSQELSPLKTEFAQINYAKAKELVALFSANKEGSGILSGRGSLAVDERTNTILITDTESSIEKIRRVIAHLDLPVQQVLIEARIVIANTNFNKELGVKWANQNYHFNGNKVYQSGSSIESLDTQAGGFAAVGTTGALPQNGTALGLGAPFGSTSTSSGLIKTSPTDLAVDLGATGAGASSIAFGLSSLSSGLLQVELSALESSGNADIIATPKVLTADQQMAKISSGTQIPYQEASSSGATSVTFKDAVLSLEVTPQITPDGRVIMKLKVNQDSVGALFDKIPSIDKNEIDTSVLVENGETVVLGGVFRNEEISSLTKTPFFGDLPIVGYLFRHTIKRTDKKELLIFVTPNIVKNALVQK